MTVGTIIIASAGIVRSSNNNMRVFIFKNFSLNIVDSTGKTCICSGKNASATGCMWYKYNLPVGNTLYGLALIICVLKEVTIACLNRFGKLMVVTL